jgi:hypothetical protein
MMKSTLLGAKNILRKRRTAESKAKAAKSKVTKAGEYTAKGLLVLAQPYIRTSENAIEGSAQKRNKFWDDIAEAFKV